MLARGFCLDTIAYSSAHLVGSPLGSWPVGVVGRLGIEIPERAEEHHVVG